MFKAKIELLPEVLVVLVLMDWIMTFGTFRCKKNSLRSASRFGTNLNSLEFLDVSNNCLKQCHRPLVVW